MEDLKESAPYDRVVLHPLVLLSAVDHFNRIGNVSRNARVVGALLGATKIIDGKRVLDISNSFAVPFDEDSKDASVWYLDHDYLDEMFKMYRKVNAKERIVGWYHTGPELRANDTEINEIFKQYWGGGQTFIFCIFFEKKNSKKNFCPPPLPFQELYPLNHRNHHQRLVPPNPSLLLHRRSPRRRHPLHQNLLPPPLRNRSRRSRRSRRRTLTPRRPLQHPRHLKPENFQPN